MKLKLCELCEQPIPKGHRNKKYCGMGCKNKAHSLWMHDNNPSKFFDWKKVGEKISKMKFKGYVRNCLECGITFKTPKSRNQKFCCYECSHQYQIIHPLKERISKEKYQQYLKNREYLFKEGSPLWLSNAQFDPVKKKKIAKTLKETFWKNYTDENWKRDWLSKVSNGVKQAWVDKKDIMLGGIAKLRTKYPTNFESRIESLMIRNKLPFITNGHGRFLYIGRCVPDFIHVDDKPVVLEALGCYWHECPICKIGIKGRFRETLRRHWFIQRRGYKVIEIWEHMNDEEIISKVKELLERWHLN